jgi:hypothetical protein
MLVFALTGVAVANPAREHRAQETEGVLEMFPWNIAT